MLNKIGKSVVAVPAQAKKGLLFATSAGSAYLMTAMPANAAIDISDALTEMDAGQTALESLGTKAIAVAVVAFALFFVFRRVPKG